MKCASQGGSFCELGSISVWENSTRAINRHLGKQYEGDQQTSSVIKTVNTLTGECRETAFMKSVAAESEEEIECSIAQLRKYDEENDLINYNWLRLVSLLMTKDAHRSRQLQKQIEEYCQNYNCGPRVTWLLDIRQGLSRGINGEVQECHEIVCNAIEPFMETTESTLVCSALEFLGTLLFREYRPGFRQLYSILGEKTGCYSSKY